MSNYKIKVNNEAESREAQELFEKLKYKPFNVKRVGMVAVEKNTIYCDFIENWDHYIGGEITLPQLRDLVAQSKNEQGLISGADALRALADGKEVEYLYGDKWLSVIGEQVLITAIIDDKFKFRLKPRTITLNVEIPAPFEPKENDIFWTLSTNYECGYVQILCYRNDEQGERLSQFGAWRTEEEIKQVVAALRGALK